MELTLEKDQTLTAAKIDVIMLPSRISLEGLPNFNAYLLTYKWTQAKPEAKTVIIWTIFYDFLFVCSMSFMGGRWSCVSTEPGEALKKISKTVGSQ